MTEIRMPKKMVPPKSGAVWDKSDEDHLRRMFMYDESLENMARTLGRKPHAIVTRLVRLGLVVLCPDIRGYKRVIQAPWVTWSYVSLLTERLENECPEL